MNLDNISQNFIYGLNMIKTVIVKYIDGTTDIKECHDLSEIPLDNVVSIRVVREEDEVNHANTNCDHIIMGSKISNKRDN